MRLSAIVGGLALATAACTTVGGTTTTSRTTTPPISTVPTTTAPAATTTPSTTVPAEPQLTMACGAAEAPYADHPPTTEEWNLDVMRAIQALETHEEGRWFVENHDFGEWARDEDGLVLLGTRHYRFPRVVYAYAEFESVNGEWLPVAWGTCSWDTTIADMGTASWVLDPAHPPDPDSDTLHVLATERDCANGRPPDGRAVDTIVMHRPDEVHIVVIVEPVEGGADCPSNPSFPLEVDLGTQLGDRAPVDASSVPGRRRHLEEEMCTPRDAGLPEQQGLPEAVAETRAAIHRAVSECDWETLTALAAGGIGYADGALGYHGDPVPYWRGETRYSGPQPGTLELIAGMLELSYTTGEVFLVGERSDEPPMTTYMWPAVSDEEHRSDADWDELLGVYDSEYVELLRDGPEGYAGGFVVVIAEDGTWLFALVVST